MNYSIVPNLIWSTTRQICQLHYRTDITGEDWYLRQLPEIITTGTVIWPVQVVTEVIFLSGQWDHSAVWTLLTAPSRNILTYLLTNGQWSIDRHHMVWGALRIYIPIAPGALTAPWWAGPQGQLEWRKCFRTLPHVGYAAKFCSCTSNGVNVQSR